jgi:cobalt-zinc-cadmium resistance protein CzcA
MIRQLIRWSLDNRLIVFLLVGAWIAAGLYSLAHLNIEAYPDPAPAVIEVIAQRPGTSAEEIERQVSVPLEVALAGMPGLKYTRSKSVFGLSHVRNQFEYGIPYERAKQEVLNRLNGADLPADVTPKISPTSTVGEIYRYLLSNPREAGDNETYTLHDLKSLQDGTLEKKFRRIPRIADVVSFGGQVKRYEVQPDPDRLRQYDITLEQMQVAIAESNGNVGGDFVSLGPTVQAVRGLGLIGQGRDPLLDAFTQPSAATAGRLLREAEEDRLDQIRHIVLAATNNVPVLVEHLCPGTRAHNVEGGGVLVGHHTRLGTVSASLPKLDAQGHQLTDTNGRRIWRDLNDTVQGIVLLRKGEPSLPALADVKETVNKLNTTPGQILPGVKLETFYDRSELVERTTHTVRENVLVGLGLVTLILLVFLNNARSAFIVAINIPLALLCAFAALHFRGRSANLLSLGAVDFGIIADSSIIVVESIYRFLALNTHPQWAWRDRIASAVGGVERSLFYATIIMVCALLPLFTMQGPEGQIFGPMAETYGFALAGALVLSLTLSPVLCGLLFKNAKPRGDNFLVRGLKRLFLGQLNWMLRHRRTSLAAAIALLLVTIGLMPRIGREFMPELEEGNLYIRSTFPVMVSLDEVARKAAIARELLKEHPEVESVMSQCGRPDDGTDPTGFYNAEFLATLHPHDHWPTTVEQQGWRRWIFGAKRAATKSELVARVQDELNTKLIGIDWNISQYIRDNVLEILSGVKGDNCVKIIGPDLVKLEQLANQVKHRLQAVDGIAGVGVFAIQGQTNLEFPIDRAKCSLWNVSVADVHDALETAVGGKSFSEMVEGERHFDITLRWPESARRNAEDILNIPIEVVKNRGSDDVNDATTDRQLALAGNRSSALSLTGSSIDTTYNRGDTIPRRPLRDLVTPLDDQGRPNPGGPFVKIGASTIYREQSQRMIAVKFSVRGRDLASAVAEAQSQVAPLVDQPYRLEFSGEFQQMQQAVHRLGVTVAFALALILVLLYLALRSWLDAAVVFSNVLVMSMGGIWALYLTGTTLNISAGVGFVSVLGVGMMNGLLMVAGFNQGRGEGLPVKEAIRVGTDKLIRPLTMTALAAIFGLLPPAFSQGIGSETQRPLAIVVVGSMIMTLAMFNLVGLLYSFYGHRERTGDVSMGH